MTAENTTSALVAAVLAYTMGRVTILADMGPIVILGVTDQTPRALEHGFLHVRSLTAGREISLASTQADIDVVAGLLEEPTGMARRNTVLDVAAVEQATGLLKCLTSDRAPTGGVLSACGHSIRPETPGQKVYTDAIDRTAVVLGIGPVGTDKTYPMMAQTVHCPLSGEVCRIVLTRSTVEAGENLDFLPGSLTDKIDPYLSPLYDAPGDIPDPEALLKLMAVGTIGVAPLMYMCGCALNDSFIILGEAQGTTVGQMKMFLTRLGFSSKVTVMGDTSRIDLPGSRTSDPSVVRDILGNIDDIEFCHLTSVDVARHELAGAIIGAYQRFDDRNAVRRVCTHSHNTVYKEYV